MKLGKNDILLHYEDLGDYDLKIQIDVALVTEYVRKTTGLFYPDAEREARKMRNPKIGWAMVMDDDERFYEWCKYRFRNIALSKRAKKKGFALYTVSKTGKIVERKYRSEFLAIEAYEIAKERDEQVVLFKITLSGERYSDPYRKHNCDKVLELLREGGNP